MKVYNYAEKFGIQQRDVFFGKPSWEEGRQLPKNRHARSTIKPRSTTRKGAATNAVDSTELLLAERYPPEALSARSVKIVTSGRAKNRNGTKVVPTPREICIVSSAR